MTRPLQRIIAIVGALLFLFSSLSLSAAVIWQIVQNNKASKTNPTSSQQKGANVLQGTKLSGFTPVGKIDSLQKIDKVVGTGPETKPGDTVTAHYTGAVAATGIIFQSSHDTGQPIPFSLGQVIKGWADGVPGMRVGGKRRLLIPADEAYGANPPAGSGIPANADLVFDIELVKIGQ
ncbi:FKBP-type peptidyl-prolyl cis-trans isomerase [Candidatus Saccharibacteria bacterium]|nr:FKBP-type peptidyl-prolyl cis-trans isomerase [Candidatus Saccharibacteria bacterium]